jgi:hypothetical protein
VKKAVLGCKSERRAHTFHELVKTQKAFRVSLDAAPGHARISLIGKTAEPADSQLKAWVILNGSFERCRKRWDNLVFHFSQELESEVDGWDRNPSNICFAGTKALLKVIEHLPAFIGYWNCNECAHIFLGYGSEVAGLKSKISNSQLLPICNLRTFICSPQPFLCRSIQESPEP